jgi:hypothetical protein
VRETGSLAGFAWKTGRFVARVIAVGLVDLRLQHGPHASRFNTNHWQARFGENGVMTCPDPSDHG